MNRGFDRRVPYVLCFFFLAGSCYARSVGWVPPYAPAPAAAAASAQDFLLLQWGWNGLLLFLGSSLVGAFLLPVVFFFSGTLLTSRLDPSLQNTLTAHMLTELLPVVVSLSGALYTGSSAFDSAVSLFYLASDGDSRWRAMPPETYLCALAFSLLSAIIFFILHT